MPTSPDRLRYLISVNHRLRRFAAGVRRHGWDLYPSEAADDCIIVAPTATYWGGDHFVLYPSGAGQTSALSVYDGRNYREFSPVPARSARAWIADNPARQ